MGNIKIPNDDMYTEICIYRYVYTDMLRVTTTTTCPHINILMWRQLTWWLRYMLLIMWYVCMLQSNT